MPPLLNLFANRGPRAVGAPDRAAAKADRQRRWRMLRGAFAAIVLGSSALTPRLVDAASGGVFVVNGGGDDNAYDGALTLREAILAANGGTGAAGLNRSISDGEKTQLTGCTFTQDLSALPFSAWFVSGGCAAGADTVRFDAAVTQVSLTDALPNLAADGTRIQGLSADGNSTYWPRIDGAGVGGTFCSDGFVVAANDVEISYLTVVNLRPASQSVNYSCADVLILSGAGAVITHNFLGAPSTSVACNADGVTRNAAYGVHVLANSAGGPSTPIARIGANTIVCHGLAGILVENGAHHVFINPLPNTAAANLIGVTDTGHVLPNGTGIATGQRVGSTYTDGLFIAGNVISGNLNDGVRLRGVMNATLNANVVGLSAPDGTGGRHPLGNGGSGLVIDDTSNVSIDSNLLNSPGTVSTIAANGGNGIMVANSVGTRMGRTQGALPVIGSPLVTEDNPPLPSLACRPGWGNAGYGVLLETGVSGADIRPATVACNGLAGIATRGTAGGNTIVPGLVALNGGLPIDIGDDGPTRVNDPAILGLTPGSGPVVLSGSACANCTVALYVAIGNPAAAGGGGLWLSTASANTSGGWSLTIPSLTVPPLDAWLPHPSPAGFAGLAIDAGGNSYELNPRPELFLPSLHK